MRSLKVGAAMVGVAVGLAMSLAARAAPAEIGKPAPDFAITTLDKQVVRPQDLKGKVVVVNRWATWCTPCKAEMIVFDKYMRAHPNTDLKIYAVTTELAYPSYKLQPLQKLLAYPLAISAGKWGYDAKDGVPTSYVIDRNGVLRYAQAGAFTEESFNELVAPLLEQAAAH
jgi:cytochrome c biogenesis protein CcmG/thiol:disulfide interchange protein DsbE